MMVYLLWVYVNKLSEKAHNSGDLSEVIKTGASAKADFSLWSTSPTRYFIHL